MRCGIDFGTSNTTMAVLRDGHPELVALEDGAPTIPTALFFTENNRAVLFGRAAVAAYLEGRDGRFMRSIKRVLGTSLMDQQILVNGTRTDFDTIIGRFLTHIKTTAESALQQPLTMATIGRPVHFQDNDTGADARAEAKLRRIAEQAGFRDVMFRYEPIAAALAHEKSVVGEQLALVIDIGGGTSDFSLIRLSRDFAATRDRAQDILGNTGIRVGGNDCDKAVNLDTAMPLLGLGTRYGDKNLEMPLLIYHELSEWAKVNWVYTPQNLNTVRLLSREAHEVDKIALLEQVLEEHLGHRILDVAENMKIALSRDSAATGDFGFLAAGLAAALSQDRLDAILARILSPVRAMMLDTLAQAGVTSGDVAIVVLTGGSTGLPVFQQWIAAHFPHAIVLQDNKLGSVGLGLVL